MEGLACRFLVPLTLLVLVPLAAAIAADEEVGYADVGGINHKHSAGTKKSNATPTASAADVDVGYADVTGNKHKQESERKKSTHIADFDPVWQKRAEEAQKAAFEAYNPNPETVTNSLNKKVKGSFEDPKLVKHANEIKKEGKKEGHKVEGQEDSHDQVKKHEGKEEEGKKKEKNKKKHEGKEEEEEKHEGKKEKD